VFLRYGEAGFPPTPFARLTQIIGPGLAFELHVEMPTGREDLMCDERRVAAAAIRRARQMIREDVRRNLQ